MQVVRWSAAQARTAIDTANLDRTIGAAHDRPAVVVDIDVATDDEPIAAALATLPVITIGFGAARAEGWDLILDDADTLATITDGIVATPHAAVVAAQILRGQPHRSTADGLVVESLAYATLQAGPEFAAWLAGQGAKTRRVEPNRVRVDVDDRGATVWLTRGRLHNLMDATMRDELVDALRALRLSDGPISLRAEGPSFCAGGDPAEFGTVADPVAAHAIRSSANVAPVLHAVADRVRAHVHGACVGAGVELASVCQQVVADPHTRFRLPETSMGLLPGAGGTVSIPARIGRRRTLEWLLSNRELDTETALAWGLIDEIEPVEPLK